MRKFAIIFLVNALLFYATGTLAQDSENLAVAPMPKEISLLIETSQNYIDRKGSSSQDLEKALLYCKKAEALSNRLNSQSGKIRSLLLHSKICREGDKYPQGEKFMLKALQLAENYSDYSCKGETLVERSYYYDWGRGLPDKVRSLELALEAFRIKSSRKQLADLLSLLADQHFNIGEYNKAIAEGKEALAIYGTIGGGNLQQIYATLGIAYTKLGLYEEGIRYSLLAAKIGEGMDDTSGEMMTIYNHIGLSYYYNKELNQARIYHEKYLELAILNKKSSGIFVALDNIVNDLLKTGQVDEAFKLIQTIDNKYSPEILESKITLLISKIKVYTAMGALDTAMNYCNAMLSLVQSYAGEIRPVILLNVNQTAVNLFFKTRQYGKANHYLNNNKKIASASKDIAYVLENMLWEFRLDSVSGNYLSAIKIQQRYMAAKDSLFNKVKANQISNLHVQYQTRQKDLEILKNKKNIALMAKEAQLQKVQIESDRNIKITTGVALLLSIIIIGLFYNRYIIKKKKSEQLSQQKQEINYKNESLLKLVTEKEWLLKEVHHRVKNNLQIIMSLLYAQSESLSDNNAKLAIKSSQSRVQSMALIHQKLYRSASLSSVSMPEYIAEFIDCLTESFDLERRIHFATDIENIDMDVSQAVPVGLILNEAVTNAIKHAYPFNGMGTIKISLLHYENDIFELAVEDGGKGFDTNIDLTSAQTLGMTLMRGLGSELDADLEIKNNNGVGVYLRFKYNYNTITKTAN